MSKKLVTAIDTGFYKGILRKEGVSFHVDEDARSTWFHAEGEDPLEPVDLDDVMKRNLSVPNEGLKKENAALRERLDSMENAQSDKVKALHDQIEELKGLVETATRPSRRQGP